MPVVVTASLSAEPLQLTPWYGEPYLSETLVFTYFTVRCYKAEYHDVSTRICSICLVSTESADTFEN